MFAKKSQTGLEYFMITSFIFAITVPALFIFYNYVNDTDVKAERSKAISFLIKVIDAADRVYYLGPPSKITLVEPLPRSVQNVSVEKTGEVYLLRISLKTESGINNLSKPTTTPIIYEPAESSLQGGRKTIIVRAVETSDGSVGVNISI